METSINNSKLTPKFFFISLGIIITLITSVSSFLVLFFETLNKKFPDILNSVYTYGYNSYDFETIRASLATLIIFFPVFIFISYLWLKESRSDMSNQNLIIRKWMIYLIIFIASLTIIIDLVTLVRYFISGEITLRFILKVSGTLVVAFLVDFYYSLKMKNTNFNSEKSKKWGSVVAIISIVIFCGITILSFFVMGSPLKQRSLRLDDRRINDLQNIQSQVINYWQQKEVLPVNLSDLSTPMSNYYVPIDPEFSKGKIYEYSIKDKLTFELCATFIEDIPKGLRESNYSNTSGPVFNGYDTKTSIAVPAGGMNESWNHGKGRTCFSRTIDTDIYQPFKNKIN
jgi:hypothetical protein